MWYAHVRLVSPERGRLSASMLLVVFCFCCLVFVNSPHVRADAAAPKRDEARLMEKLFNEYDATLRPVENHTHTINVSLKLQPVALLEVDEAKETAVFSVWLKKSWKDYFISWDPAEYGGLKELRVPRDKIWLPDILVYEDPKEGYDMNPMVVVMSSGDVIYVPAHTHKFICTVDISYFPGDELICKATYGSWVYNGLQVHLQPTAEGSTDLDMSSMKSSKEFHFVEAFAEFRSRKYDCCVETYDDMLVTIKLHRKTSQLYLSTLLLPALMVALLCPLVFVLPSGKPHRFGLGGTLLICLTLLMMMLGEAVPPSPEPPIITQYFCGLFFLVSLSLALSTLIANLVDRDARLRPVPSIIKVVSGCLAKPMCVRVRNPYDRVLHSSQNNSRMAAEDLEEIQPRPGDTIRSDWQVLAAVLDRLFFLIFLVLILILSVAILPKIASFK